MFIFLLYQKLYYIVKYRNKLPDKIHWRILTLICSTDQKFPLKDGTLSSFSSPLVSDLCRTSAVRRFRRDFLRTPRFQRDSSLSWYIFGQVLTNLLCCYIFCSQYLESAGPPKVFVYILCTTRHIYLYNMHS